MKKLLLWVSIVMGSLSWQHVVQADSFEVIIEAEAMAIKTTGSPAGAGWGIWSNGYIEDSFTVPQADLYEIAVVARGNYVANAWPNMEVKIDNVVMANISVDATDWAGFPLEKPLGAGSHTVRVAFTNDYWNPPDDRNLQVDKIIIRQSVPAPVDAPELLAAAPGDAQVSLSWSAVAAAAGYTVKSGLSSGSYDQLIEVSQSTAYTVSGLTNGRMYYFAVCARNGSGNGPNSNALSARPVNMLPLIVEAEQMPEKTVGQLTAEGDGWVLSGSAGYIATTFGFAQTQNCRLEVIGRGIPAEGVWPELEMRLDGEVIGTVTVDAAVWSVYPFEREIAPYTHTLQLSFPNDYYAPPENRDLLIDKVIITAADSSVQPPSAPVLQSIGAADRALYLRWTAVSAATAYTLHYGTAGTVYGEVLSVGDVNEYVLNGLQNGTTYYCAVTAENAAGSSGYSNELSAAPTAESAANTVTIQEGAITNHPDITLLIDSAAGYEIQISEYADFTGAEWESYRPEENFHLSEADGNKIVYVKFRNMISLQESTAQAVIILDTTAPHVSILAPQDNSTVTGK